MKKYLIITIDTEIDSPRWRPEFPYSLENIKAIPRLQDLFNKYGVRPTYLITYSVADDKESVKILGDILSKGLAEIGAHLHPWETPPFSSDKEKFELSYPHHSNLEEEKLTQLTNKIEESFSKRPISYRAGRYGFDKESLKILEKLGYLVDTSITPTMNWVDDGGPNFSNIKNTQPYYLDSILEVPISIKIKGRIFPGYASFSPRIKAILKKIGFTKTIWLRPSTSSFEEMRWLSDSIIKEGGHVLNMMFHSNELMAGASPYIKTFKEEKFFWQKLEKILNYFISEKKMESKTLSELYNIYSH